MKWIKVSQKLPKPGQVVFNYGISFGRSIYGVGVLIHEDGSPFFAGYDITHWAYLSQPKEEGDWTLLIFNYAGRLLDALIYKSERACKIGARFWHNEGVNRFTILNPNEDVSCHTKLQGSYKLKWIKGEYK